MKDKPWSRRAIVHGLPLALLVVALFYYWFAIADRYVVFLYYHDMGPSVPDTSPFSRVTASRYWMTGLVASGFVTVIYCLANWLVGRFRSTYAPPPWTAVWLVCAPTAAAGILVVTMGTNSPRLPLGLAGAVALVTVLGLALALYPAKIAARQPWELVWLTADGLGLMLVLITLAQLDDISRWLAAGYVGRAWLALLLPLLGIAWLLALSLMRCWRRVAPNPFFVMLAYGFWLTYLLLPLLHYTLFSDGYFYITNSDNFLAGSAVLQVLAWSATTLITWAVTALRRRLAR